MLFRVISDSSSVSIALAKLFLAVSILSSVPFVYPVIKNSKLDETQIWVYIIDLPPSQMIEYGEVLPESGKEKEWFYKLSKKLKKKLSKIGN